MVQRLVVIPASRTIDCSDSEELENIRKEISPVVEHFKVQLGKFAEEFMTGRRGAAINKKDVFLNIYDLEGWRRNHDENVRTALHELAHLMTKSKGHTLEFVNNFMKIAKWAKDNGHYSGRIIYKSLGEHLQEGAELRKAITTHEGKKVDLKDFDPREVAMGMVVEREHTEDKEKLKRIIAEHLLETPRYYSRLKRAGL